MDFEIPQVTASERTPLVDKLCHTIDKLIAECLRDKNTIELLKEELNRLKGLKNKPKIKPSKMESKAKKGKEGKKNTATTKVKNKELKKEEVVIKVENIPVGSEFKGYQFYKIQELVIEAKEVSYQLERWLLPDGTYAVAKLPEAIQGSHFGPVLRSYIMNQNLLGVTEPQILEQLKSLGFEISSGEISHLLIDNKDSFHEEKNALLQSSFSASQYINVDDTGARHDGHNGFCTHIGNELFAWFKSTESKSRINFLELLRCEHKDYVLDSNAIEYMKKAKMPRNYVELMSKNEAVFDNKDSYLQYLNNLGIKTKRLVRIATEGALVGSVLSHGYPANLTIVSDDAGQFNIFQHALCWIHAERLLTRLVPLNKNQAKSIKSVLSKFWKLYASLKSYKLNPTKEAKERIEKKFDELCITEASYPLKNALQKLAKNKKELLLVLDHPEIPLHNNVSENDIREYVKKRKISGGTRSEAGRQYRDTFISLKKTCRKLGVNFWEYLLDRNCKKNLIPYLPTLIGRASLANTS